DTCNGVDERRALIALALVPGLGPTRIRTMISHLGSAVTVLDESAATLSSIAGIGEGTAERISAHARRPDLVALVDRQFAKAESVGAAMVTAWDADFPEMLRRTADPPLFLWVAGK